ncbi:MAG: SAM-dependent methyltransferase, partial [Reyranella sp.]
FRYRSPGHFMEIFQTFYGPVLKAFAALVGEKQRALHADLMALMARLNRASDGTLVVPSEYLEVVITKAEASGGA